MQKQACRKCWSKFWFQHIYLYLMQCVILKNDEVSSFNIKYFLFGADLPYELKFLFIICTNVILFGMIFLKNTKKLGWYSIIKHSIDGTKSFWNIINKYRVLGSNSIRFDILWLIVEFAS